ncbi:MAG TPA: hypothetical protein VFJ82_15630 [Longimicrobium sp.]|nr:hypothetical protein [Longimicrobium sp.]
MRRTKLKLETLQVDSFETAPFGQAGRGTVRAHLYAPDNTIADYDESGPLACASLAVEWCHVTPTATGCVESTSTCNYVITSLC